MGRDRFVMSFGSSPLASARRTSSSTLVLRAAIFLSILVHAAAHTSRSEYFSPSSSIRTS